MSAVKQRTVAGRTFYSGIALHTGVRASLAIAPADAGSGIVFSRVDLPGKPRVKAVATNVVDVRRGTTIKDGDAVVLTVEHVLASLHAFGIDNALVEMDGPEPPIADGSAKPYWEMLLQSGAVEQDADVDFWTASEPIAMAQGEVKLAIFPDDKFRISCIVDYGATPLDAQSFSGTVTPETFGSGIAPARTFAMYREIEQLISMGLAKGGSLDNAIIIHDGAIISKDGLRFENELVRHKVLDIVGDLFLVGARVRAHVIAFKPGHPANVAMALRMIEQKNRRA